MTKAIIDTELSKNTLRQYILLTLIHTEHREPLDKEVLIERIITLFICRSVVLATEKHGEGQGEHYHVGIWATNASKNTLRKALRKAFPEWEGRSIDISVHKGWGSLCKYILKEDKNPLIWGEFNLEQLRNIAEAYIQHKEANVTSSNITLLKRLSELEDWYQVYRDEVLSQKVLTSLPRMREAFEDLKVLKDIEITVLERLIDYLAKKGEPKEYDVEDLKEKYLVIDWIACQLCFKRPIKTKQLFIYGEPSTQKTLLLHFFGKVLRIYFASSRRNDFAGANDHYDLWVFDEFHEHSEQNSYGGDIIGSTTEGSSFVNNLLKVLDGQECRLDSKYSKVFKKKRNVPIIMIANKLPQLMERHGPFRARFFRIRFSTQIQELEEERIIATLYGCIIRRIRRSPYCYGIRTPEEVKLTYNKENALILPIVQEQKDMLLQKIQEWNNALANVEPEISSKKQIAHINFLMETQAMLLTSEGKVYQIKVKRRKVDKENLGSLFFEIVKIDGGEWQNWGNPADHLTLLDFASIPIKKEETPKHPESNKDFLKLFQQQDEDEEDASQEKPEAQNIKRVKTLFFDKKERTWLRYRGTKLEGVCSIFNVQRSAREDEHDYAMWPLEIKIYLKADAENEAKIFPLLIQNLNEPGESQQEINKEYCKMRILISSVIEEARVDTLKCEISLSRNGEKQRWNLEC